MACQLIASRFLPELVVKALLYPAALTTSFANGTAIPAPDQLLNSYKFKTRKIHASTDLKHLEVIAGSYLAVVGAFLGLVKRGRMSFFGLILIVWGIAREMFALGSSKSLCTFPVMIMTVVIAFLSVRRDVRKLIKCFSRPNRVAKRLKNRLKAKRS